MINFVIIGIITALAFNVFSIDFSLGLRKIGLKEGLKKYAWVGGSCWRIIICCFWGWIISV